MSETSASAAGGRLLFNVNVLLLAQVANYSLRFFTGIILARGLGPELRGDYALFVLSASFGASILTLGAGLGSMYHAGKSRYPVSVLVGNSQFVGLLAIAVAFVVVLCVGLIADASILVSKPSFWLYILAFPAVLEFTLLTALLVGLGRFVGLNLALVTQTATVLAGAAALYIVGELSLFNVVLVWGSSYMVGTVVALGFLGLSDWSIRAVLRPSVEVLGRQIKTGIPGQIGNSLQFLNYRLDQFVVAGLGTRADVGIYAVAVGMSETVWWMANAVAMALLPRLTRMDGEKGAEVTATACRNILLVASMGALALSALSPIAVHLLFGEAFSGAIRAIFFLMPGVVALSGAKVISSYVFSQGKMAVTSGIAVLALGGTVVFDLLLIPPFGIAGAAAASSIAYSATLIMYLGYYERLSGNRFTECLLLRVSDLRLYMSFLQRARQRASMSLLGSGGKS